MNFCTISWFSDLLDKIFVRWWKVRLKNTQTHVSLEVIRVKRAFKAAKVAWHIQYADMPQLVLENLQNHKPFTSPQDERAMFLEKFRHNTQMLIEAEKVRMANLGANFNDVYSVGDNFQLIHKPELKEVDNDTN